MVQNFEGKPQGIPVYISNLSLPASLMMAGSATQHARYLDTINADGEEVTPYKGRLMSELRNAAADMVVSPEADTEAIATLKRVVKAGHVSFRKTLDDDGLVARAFPKWQDSLLDLRQAQQVVGRMPAVLYPDFVDGPVAFDDSNAPFARRTFQPTRQNWHELGLAEESTTDDVLETLDRVGFSGVTIDVFHIQTEGDTGGFKDPVSFAGRLATAGIVQSAHVSLNRTDITGRSGIAAVATQTARRAFMHSSAKARNTLEGNIVNAIVTGHQQSGSDNQFFAVLEDGPFRLPGSAIRDQSAIIEHTREMLVS